MPGPPGARPIERVPTGPNVSRPGTFGLFKSLMLNFCPWGLSVSVVRPLGSTRTRVLLRSYAPDPDRVAPSAGSDLHRVEMEDEKMVEAVQRGLRSRRRDTGRCSPPRERGPYYFHPLLGAELGP